MGAATIAATGFGALSAYSSYKKDSAQAKVSEAVRQYNNKQAIKSLVSSYNALEDTTDQVNENMISQSLDIQEAAAKARGSALANAGAAGVGGSAVDMQIDDINNKSAGALAKATLNKSRQLSQIKSQADAAQSDAAAAMDIVPTQKVSALSYIMSGVNAGTSSYSTFKWMDDTISGWFKSDSDSDIGSE